MEGAFSLRKSLTLASSLISLDPASSKNATVTLVEKLILQNSQQVKISILIVASLNITAALAVIIGVLFDARIARKMSFASEPIKSFWPKIHPAEILPLVMSVAVIIQSSIFIGVQSGVLSRFFVRGCRLTAELVWPASWLVAYTVVIFGLETTFRSLRSNRFCGRGRWTTPVCLILIVLLESATWLPSFLLPERDKCLGTLIWWTSRYAIIGLILGAGLILTYVLSAAIITIQLLRTSKLDHDERIAATKVVYYLSTTVIIISLVVPYYIQIMCKINALRTPHMASIVLNLGGILNGLLYLFLRSNAERFAIRSKDTPWTTERAIRLFGPNDLTTGMQISSPVLFKRDASSERRYLSLNQDQIVPIPLLSLPTIRVPRSSILQPRPAFQQAPPPPHPTSAPLRNNSLRPPVTKSRYSLFPTRGSERRPQLSWSTTRSSRSSQTIQLPDPLFARGHRRDDSAQTTETVQIGLRLSHAMPELPERTPSTSSSSSSTYELPIQYNGPPPRHPSPLAQTSSNTTVAQRGDTGSDNGSSSKPPLSTLPANPHPTNNMCERLYAAASRTASSRRLMKSLPPVPNPIATAATSSDDLDKAELTQMYPLHLRPPSIPSREDEEWPLRPMTSGLRLGRWI
ncbi:hypothetical protein MMC25_005728 [Agyrium rufum]|nr:hypothetical protein [Agyrium rufum]